MYLAEVRTPDGLTHKQAIKLMHADLELDEDLAARARDEARLMSQLHHDHVVAVHALTRLEDRWAVFMEYVQGIDAGALLGAAEGGLPPRVAVAMIERACAALDAAWNQPSPDTGRPLRVVHRDLKPANLMLSVEGSLKVMDFGVARADFDREAHTQSTQYGTGRYMAPERWLHIRAEHPSDVYALGVTLYEMLTGLRFERMPLAPVNFERKLDEMLACITPEQDPAGEVTRILRGMLAFEEEARPSAAQAMDALDQAAEDLSGPSLRRYARAVVPPLLKERQRELLSDSVVWPGGGPITPTPGSRPASNSLNSGPTAETRAEPNTPAQPAAAAAPPAAPQEGSGPELSPPSEEGEPERSLVLPAIGGVGLGLALIAGGLAWMLREPPELETPPAPTVNIAEVTPEAPEATPELVPEPEPETERAPEAEPEPPSEPKPASVRASGGTGRSGTTSSSGKGSTPTGSGSTEVAPVQEDPVEPVRVVVPKEQPAETEAKVPVKVKLFADPIGGSVSYKGQTVKPYGAISLEPGPHTLTWRWEDGVTLTCTVQASAGKTLKFDKHLEKCK